MQEYSVLQSLVATTIRSLREFFAGPARRGPGFAVLGLLTLEALRRSGHGGFPLGPFLALIVVHAAVVDGSFSALLTALLTTGYELLALRASEGHWALAHGSWQTVGIHAAVSIVIVGLCAVARRGRL